MRFELTTLVIVVNPTTIESFVNDLNMSPALLSPEIDLPHDIANFIDNIPVATDNTKLNYFPFMPTCANLYNISNFKIHNFEIFYMKNQYFRIADDSVNNRVLSLVYFKYIS
jgi:hypothetical protein